MAHQLGDDQPCRNPVGTYAKNGMLKLNLTYIYDYIRILKSLENMCLYLNQLRKNRLFGQIAWKISAKKENA